MALNHPHDADQQRGAGAGRGTDGLIALPAAVLQLDHSFVGHVDRRCTALLRADSPPQRVPVEVFAASLESRLCQVCADVEEGMHLYEGLEELRAFLLAPPRPRLRARDEVDFVAAGISDLDRDRWWMLGFTAAGATDVRDSGLSLEDAAKLRRAGKTSAEIVRDARARSKADESNPELREV